MVVIVSLLTTLTLRKGIEHGGKEHLRGGQTGTRSVGDIPVIFFHIEAYTKVGSCNIEPLNGSTCKQRSFREVQPDGATKNCRRDGGKGQGRRSHILISLRIGLPYYSTIF